MRIDDSIDALSMRLYMYAFMTHCDVCLRVGEPLGGDELKAAFFSSRSSWSSWSSCSCSCWWYWSSFSCFCLPGAKPLILPPLAMTMESEVDPTQQPELAHLFRLELWLMGLDTSISFLVCLHRLNDLVQSEVLFQCLSMFKPQLVPQLVDSRPWLDMNSAVVQAIWAGASWSRDAAFALEAGARGKAGGWGAQGSQNGRCLWQNFHFFGGIITYALSIRSNHDWPWCNYFPLNWTSFSTIPLLTIWVTVFACKDERSAMIKQRVEEGVKRHREPWQSPIRWQLSISCKMNCLWFRCFWVPKWGLLSNWSHLWNIFHQGLLEATNACVWPFASRRERLYTLLWQSVRFRIIHLHLQRAQVFGIIR